MFLIYLSFLSTQKRNDATRQLDDTISQAQTALLSESYDQVFVILEGADRAFERSVTIVSAQDLSTVFYYRGVAAQLNQGDGIPHFRSALTAYPSLEWDTDLSTDDLSQDIFAQVKREIAGRSKIDPLVPEKVGLAKVYINGVQRNFGEKVPAGTHLAQIKCPKVACTESGLILANPSNGLNIALTKLMLMRSPNR